ncbi:HEAT repeat domain-containing protein [Cryomorphaceae bacterium 1068]|nr:HEAT repeat domain-containing protein [Cryomorphaceae bacterium 1068]
MGLEKFVKEHKNEWDDGKMPFGAQPDFEARLKSELHGSADSKRGKRIRVLSIAATILVLVTLGTVFTFNKLDEIETRDKFILALGEDQTNSTRLEAIYEIEDLNRKQKEDEKILIAFFKILKEDSDTHSKLAVIDALMAFPDNQLVRDNIIEALAKEKEPLVQLKLIKSVTILREQRAKAPLEEIINDTESLPLVKGNAYASLAMFNEQ